MTSQAPPFDPWMRDWRRGAEHLHERLHHAGRAHRPPRGWYGAFGRGFPFGPGFAGGGRRAGRGDIRAAILALLAEKPMHGYQIIQELSERSEGAWRPSPGSVYPTLQQLEDEGLVRAVESDAGRRVYELTDPGRAEAAAAGRPWEDASGDAEGEMAGMRDLFLQVAAATWQVVQAGSGRQRAAAADILRDTRRRLYQLLAEDAPETSGAEGDQPSR
ncbi:MAG TPA: PadR family transcriptional regulator [Candidatus Dormibacteraeota bacterium]|jgi:DNA-binding PadR family transcriptional regulator|nr:PadR family transcriptional regulator [Candidatus Dormibacteraeota bacterium]